MKKFLLNLVLAFVLVVTQIPSASAEEVIEPTITASGQEGSNVIADYAFDGDDKTRWASEAVQNKEHWIQIEYNKSVKVGTIDIAWERANVNELQILGLQDGVWNEIFTRSKNPGEFDESIVLDKDYTLEGLKIVIKDFNATSDDRSGKSITWSTVSIYEVSTTDERYDIIVSENNLMLNQDVVVSDVENGTSFTGEKIVDGDLSTRWATNRDVAGADVLFTLDGVYKIESFKILWDERLSKDTGEPDPNIVSYNIEYSLDGVKWTTAHSRNELLATISETINLDKTIHAKYVKLTILESIPGANSWNNISLREFEAYSHEIDPDVPMSLSDVKEIKLNEDNTSIVLPEIVGSESLVVSGTDSPGVIDLDGKVTQPLQDKVAEISLTLTKSNKEETKAFKIKVKGLYENEGIGTKPVITPNIQEWYGLGETFEISSYKLDFSKAQKFSRVGEIYTQDLKELGKVVGNEASSTPVIFEEVRFGEGADEVYVIELNADSIVIKAQAYVGALHATRTLLQIDDSNIATGIIRDYPSFGMRSFMLDVGRKFVPYEEVVELMKNLAFYKYNDFQLHLNDNFIWLSDHNVKDFETDQEYLDYVLNNAETGFRLDVSMENDEGVRLTSDDHYTKEEFRNLVSLSQDLGILLVPELDTPGHALSFVKVRPDLMYNGDVGGRDISERAAMLDLENPDTLPFIKSVYDELFEDLFKDLPVIHIGSDEYYGNTEAYRQYLDDMIEYIQVDQDRTPRVWGSLGYKQGKTPVRAKDVQLDIWNLGWNPVNMAMNDGFDFINILDGTNYIVPSGNGGRGGYGDYLSTQNVYNNWAPNIFGGTTIPASHPQLVGGSYALWNDLVDVRDTGITSHDMMVRTYDSLPFFTEKMWGSKTGLSYQEFVNKNIAQFEAAPGTDPLSSKNFEDIILELENVNKNHKTGIEEATYRQNGEDLMINMTLNLNSDSKNQIIAKGPRSIIFATDEEGYFAYQFENYLIQFDTKLPVDEYVEVEMVLSDLKTRVFVNGSEVERREHSKYKKLLHTSLVAPMETLNVSIDGTLDNFDVFYGEYVDLSLLTMDDIKSVTANDEEVANDGFIKYAFDNDLSTLWHTTWSKATPYPHIVDVEFNEPETLQKFTYVPRQGGGQNGIITEYEVDFLLEGKIVEQRNGKWAKDSTNKDIIFETPIVADAVQFRSLNGHEGYSTAAEFAIKRTVEEVNKTALNTLIREAKALDKDSYTESSFAALQEAIVVAQTASKEEKSQDAVDKAVVALQLAIDNLVKVTPPSTTVDTKLLKAKIKEAKSVDKALYTKESYALLEKAITAAEEALKSKDQKVIDAAVESLSAAMKSLVKVDVPDIETPDTGDKPENDDKLDTDKPTTDELPKTGMGPNYAPYIMIGLSGLFFAISKKYRKQD